MFIYLKYYILTVTCVLYTIQSVHSANCPGDCIDIFLCPAGVDYLRNKNDASSINFLKNTQCGVSDEDHPLICCSMFDRNINNHPNLKLLSEACGLIGGDRIYGGQETGLYEFPWMTLISHNTRNGLTFKCGGTIINNRYILTAAHCVQGYQIAGVRIGEHNIDSETDCEGVPPKIVCESKLQDIRVEEEIPHESFQRLPYLQNDIALLRLKKPIDFKPKNARPVCLPVTSELINRNTAGVNGTVAGWGHTEHTVFSNVLLAVRVPIYSKTDCSEIHNRGNKLGERALNKLCAGELGKDSCKGDSGGPLMIEGTHGGVKRFIQHGIVSYGPGQCGSSYPGIYTDVTKYVDWILDHIKP